MTREQIETLLEQVAKGELSVEQALGQMRLAPLSELGFATLDLQHRSAENGLQPRQTGLVSIQIRQ